MVGYALIVFRINTLFRAVKRGKFSSDLKSVSELLRSGANIRKNPYIDYLFFCGTGTAFIESGFIKII